MIENKSAPSGKDAHQTTSPNYSIVKSVKLTHEEYTGIEKLIPDTSKQFRRMVKHLVFNCIN